MDGCCRCTRTQPAPLFLILDRSRCPRCHRRSLRQRQQRTSDLRRTGFDACLLIDNENGLLALFSTKVTQTEYCLLPRLSSVVAARFTERFLLQPLTLVVVVVVVDHSHTDGAHLLPSRFWLPSLASLVARTTASAGGGLDGFRGREPLASL